MNQSPQRSDSIALLGPGCLPPRHGGHAVRRSAFAAAAVLAVAVPAPRASGQGEPLTLTLVEAVARVIDDHPELRAARFAVEEAEARLALAGRPPDPAIEVEAAGDFAGNDEGEGAASLAIAQAFPLTARLARERDLGRVQVALARAEIDDAARRLVLETERTFLEALGARLRAEAKREALRLNEQLTAFLGERAEVGEVSALDVGQSRLTSEVLDLSIRNLEATERARLVRLATLAGLEPGTPIRVSGDLDVPGTPPSVPVPDRGVLMRRPEFRLALLRADEAQAELALAAASRWEDVVVRLFVEREAAVDEPEGLERNTLLGIGVSVPLPLWRSSDRVTAAPRAAVARSQAAVEAVARRIRGEATEAGVRARELWSVAARAGGDLLELAAENFDAQRQAHAAGQVAFVDVQRAQERVVELEEAALVAAEAFALAQAELRAAVADGPWNHVAIRPSAAAAETSPTPAPKAEEK